MSRLPGLEQSSASSLRTHLLERVPGDCLERLLHIDGFLGTGLEVGNVVFAVAPGLCPLRGHLEKEMGPQCAITQMAALTRE